MPNRPITATTKLTPFTSSSIPIVRRTLPETVSMPIAAIAKPAANETTVLIGGAASLPSKACEREKIDREIFRGSKSQSDLSDPRGQKSDQHDADKRTESRGSKRSRQSRRRSAIARHRIAVEGGSNRRWLSGDVKQNRSD